MARVNVDRRTVAVVLIVIAIPALLVVPNLIATRYNDGPGGAQIRLTHPHDGWIFLLHAARLSRGAALGTEASARDFAHQRWQSPLRAHDVELVYQDTESFRIPVPPGGLQPPDERRTATPRTRLTWVVWGQAGRRGPRQMIAMLDMHYGGIVWSLRRPRRGGR